MNLLKKVSETFRYGTNLHITLSSIAWKFAYFYLLLATSKQIGVSQEKLEDIVDAARNLVLQNRTGVLSGKSKTRIYIDCANSFRDLVLHALSVLEYIDEDYWDNDAKLRLFLDMEEQRVETFVLNFKEATGINLSDQRWINEAAIVAHDLPNNV